MSFWNGTVPIVVVKQGLRAWSIEHKSQG